MRYISESSTDVDDYRFRVLHGDPSLVPSNCRSSIGHKSKMHCNASLETMEPNPSSLTEINSYEIEDKHMPYASIIGQKGVIETDISMMTRHHTLIGDIVHANSFFEHKSSRDDSWVVYILQPLPGPPSEPLPSPYTKISKRKKTTPQPESGVVLVKQTKQYKDKQGKRSKHRTKSSHKKNQALVKHKKDQKSDRRKGKEGSKKGSVKLSKKTSKKGSKKASRKGSKKGLKKGSTKKSKKHRKSSKHGKRSTSRGLLMSLSKQKRAGSKPSKKSVKSKKHLKVGGTSSKKSKKLAQKPEGSLVHKSSSRKLKDHKRKREKTEKKHHKKTKHKRSEKIVTPSTSGKKADTTPKQKHWIEDEFLKPGPAAKPEDDKKLEERLLPLMETQQVSMEHPKKKKVVDVAEQAQPKFDRIQGLDEELPTYPPLPPESAPSKPKKAPSPKLAFPPMAGEKQAPIDRPPSVPKEPEVHSAQVKPKSKEKVSPRLQVPCETKPEEIASEKKRETAPEKVQSISPEAVQVRKEKVEHVKVYPVPRLEKVCAVMPEEPVKLRTASIETPSPLAQRTPEEQMAKVVSPMQPAVRVSPPKEASAVAMPVATPPVQELGITKQYAQPVTRAFPLPPERLRVNIDEILRLGAIMERRHISATKKMSFEWIAMNRHVAHLQPEAFSSHLATAVGDVQMEKSLACDALNVLMYQHTITPDEYLRLCQQLDNVNPITIGTLAHLLRTNTAFYNNMQAFPRTSIAENQ